MAAPSSDGDGEAAVLGRGGVTGSAAQPVSNRDPARASQQAPGRAFLPVLSPSDGRLTHGACAGCSMGSRGPLGEQARAPHAAGAGGRRSAESCSAEAVLGRSRLACPPLSNAALDKGAAAKQARSQPAVPRRRPASPPRSTADGPGARPRVYNQHRRVATPLACQSFTEKRKAAAAAAARIK